MTSQVCISVQCRGDYDPKTLQIIEWKDILKPIFLLLLIPKLIGKMLLKHLKLNIEERQLISPHQFSEQTFDY